MNDLADKTWKERARIGTVEYDIETNTICFLHKPDDESDDYFYWFPFGDCHTYDEYNNWIEHLRPKMWFTQQVEWDLIEVLERLGQCGNFEGIDYKTLEEYQASRNMPKLEMEQDEPF